MIVIIITTTATIIDISFITTINAMVQIIVILVLTFDITTIAGLAVQESAFFPVELDQ